VPIFEYECPEHHRHEVIRSFANRDTPWGCLTCGGTMSRLEVSVSHVPPDGVYSYAPNIGDPERFERQRQAIKDGVKVIERVPTKRQKETMEREAESAHRQSRRRS
jgi:putative FmdB family regulatory protein